MSGDDGDLERRRRLLGEEEPLPRDGRAARAQRTRIAVTDALITLIEEGELRPTSKSIAERAGVSERTIFQHFDDLEKLFSAAAERLGARILGKLTDISSDGPFEERLSAYLDELQYLHETVTPMRRAARLHEPFSPSLDSALNLWRETLRRGIDRVFATELAVWSGDARRDVIEAVALAATWSSWDNMRKHSQFSSVRARRVLELSFRTLLRQPDVAMEAAVEGDSGGSPAADEDPAGV